jgi:hypothetical protein
VIVSIVQPMKSRMSDNTATGHVVPTAGMNTSTAARIRTGTLITIHGLRRPQRVWKRSDKTPITGSMKMSRKRGSRNTVPAIA